MHFSLLKPYYICKEELINDRLNLIENKSQIIVNQRMNRNKAIKTIIVAAGSCSNV